MQNTKPLQASLDTQLLISFLFHDRYDDSEIMLKEAQIRGARNQKERDEAITSQRALLKNYPYVKFIKHLLKEGKIQINITPTSFSEMMGSPFFENILLNAKPITADNIFADGYISRSDFDAITDKFIDKLNIKSNRSIHGFKECIKNFNYYHHNLICPENDFFKLVGQAQAEVLRKIKENVFANSVIGMDGINFIHINNTSTDENSLYHDIYELSERYRIDRKRLTKDEDGHSKIMDAVPVKEINDCTIMSTCALAHQLLITMDAEDIAGNREVFHEENAKFTKTHNNRAIGEPFTPRDFIINFYKNEFMDFILSFETPEEIKEIDKENTIDKAINAIAVNDSTLLYKNKKDSDAMTQFERCAGNRQRYMEICNHPLPEGMEIIKPEDFFSTSENGYFESSAQSVARNRAAEEKSKLNIIKLELYNFQKIMKDLEKAFWRISETKQGYKAKSPSENDPYNVILKSTDALYQLLLIMNHIIKSVINNQNIQYVSENMINELAKLGITPITDNSGNVLGIDYEGLSFILQPNDAVHERQKSKVLINTDRLSDNIALLLGTNPFSYAKKGVTRLLHQYIENHAQIDERLTSAKQHVGVDEIKDYRAEAGSSSEEHLSHRDKQILGYLMNFESSESLTPRD